MMCVPVTSKEVNRRPLRRINRIFGQALEEEVESTGWMALELRFEPGVGAICNLVFYKSQHKTRSRWVIGG